MDKVVLFFGLWAQMIHGQVTWVVWNQELEFQTMFECWDVCVVGVDSILELLFAYLKQYNIHFNYPFQFI